MPDPGELRDRVRFEQRSLNLHGQRLGAWDVAGGVTRAAKMTPMLGGEEIINSRLAGRQPMIITVRDDTATRTVGTAWRAVDTRRGKIYDIKTNALQKGGLAFRELLAVETQGNEPG